MLLEAVRWGPEQKNFKIDIAVVIQIWHQRLIRSWTNYRAVLYRHLTNTGPSLARIITASHKSHRHFLFGDFINSFYFDEISEHEVVNICSTLHSGKAAGFVNISASLMKETITSIRSSLTHISNSSLSSGVVLVELKIARVVPWFKLVVSHYFQITDLFLFYPLSLKF